MAGDDLAHAPPPVVLGGGLTAVPIDVDEVEATLVFDTAVRVASADAAMHFRMGATDGNPAFDLRQPITTATLNGAALAPSELSHRDLGGGPGGEMRVVQRWVPAGSDNVLRLGYTLGTPQAAGSQAIGWSPGSTRLHFDFWFSDLYPGRYLEMWLPSNLVYDRFAVDLTVRIDNSAFDHALFANGAVATLGRNHWRILYPSRFTCLSPMLVVAAVDQLVTRSGSVSLPGSPAPVTLETFRLASTAADLAAVEAQLAGLLTDNAVSTGPYVHGDRFTTFVWSGTSRSMEYDGGTTSTLGSLRHEVFHSWFGRGIKPADQGDSWLDEAWTVYTDAPPTVEPFDLTAPPVTLDSRNPFARATAGGAYSSGRRFFAGLAAELGVSPLRSLMASFYEESRGELVTTEDLVAHLISGSGRVALLDSFHRFVYGLPFPLPTARPDLWLRDAEGDPGADPYTGPRFWDSPDLWVRNADDGGAVHQSPEHGQDNWIHARVRNRGVASAGTFVVTFEVKPWAGTEFVYPGDFLPCVAAAVGFDLPPGGATVVKARWPAALIPATGTHACVLASVYSPGDLTPGGLHVWEHNNLAQKNVTIVDLVPGDAVVLPVQLGSLSRPWEERVHVEVRRPERWPRLPVSLVHRDPEALRGLVEVPTARGTPATPAPAHPPLVRVADSARVEIAADSVAMPVTLHVAGGSTIELEADGPREPPGTTEAVTAGHRVVAAGGGGAVPLAPGVLARVPVTLRPRLPEAIGVEVRVPRNARPGEILDLDVVQRSPRGEVVGGVTLRIRVVDRARRPVGSARRDL